MDALLLQLQVFYIHGLGRLGQCCKIDLNGLQQMCGISLIMYFGQLCFKNTLYLVLIQIYNRNGSRYDFTGYQSLEV